MREIAVVGMACRFPGGIDSPEALWDALRARKVTAGPVPLDRWDTRRYVSQDESAKGKAYVERGNFLTQDIRAMDAEFFDIPPRMAESIDPQQRLLLEVSWEAWENAGLDLTAHAGRKVGVYVGGFMLDHMVTLMMPANRAKNNASTAAGMMMTMLSNRLSHAFDLRGPSMSFDTACSSSLVAFNYACQDIWAGRADMAMVGGANVMTRPEYPIGMCKGQFLARDGQCKSFDARGDGYGRAEGAGIVLLKPLEDALRDGDPVLAVVVGAGVNSDGRTPGISMPSEEAQRTLAEEVVRNHRIDRHKVRYVECHGTGTAVGDPIEARSIGSVYGQGRSGEDRVVLGSIKSNVGHMEAAAGVAGVIKAVLTLQHAEAAPLGNLETPHPDIAFDELGVRISDAAIPLARGNDDLHVAVNSFGYGGTNAHVVMRMPTAAEAQQSAQSREASRAVRHDDAPRMLPLSARRAATLKAIASSYAEMIGSRNVPLADLLHSATHRRAHLNHRAMVWGNDEAQLQEALEALAQGNKHERLVTGTQPFQGQRRPVWVLTGMGPQWWGMGQQLYQHEPEYRAAVDAADAVFQRIAGYSILAEMLRPQADSVITRTLHAQPANFMVQIGVAAMLRARGVVPGAIVGHSVGEVSAAYLAGVLSLEDALRVSHHRARLQARCAGTGAMLAVGASEQTIAPQLQALKGRVEIAAWNGPTTLTLSGEDEAIRSLAQRLTERGIFNRVLQVEVPYHSFLMDPILEELREQLVALVPRAPQVKLVSTVSGTHVNIDQQNPDFGAVYWTQNVRQPVRFMQAVQTLLDEGYTSFVEVGPHPVLASALRDTAKARGKELRGIETLRREEAEEPRIQRAVASVYAHGCDLDWDRLAPGGRFTRLPNYPWHRDALWLETDRSTLERVSLVDRPMLGVQDTVGGLVWRNDLEIDTIGYLREHVVAGVPVMPAAGYIETLLEAATAIHPEAHGWLLREGRILAPLMLAKDRATDYVTVADSATGAVAVRSIESGRTGDGVVHMTASVLPLQAAVTRHVDLAALQKQMQIDGESMPVDAFYRDLVVMGLQYGPRFQALREIIGDPTRGRVLARIALSPEHAEEADAYHAHPCVLDAAFQTLVGLFRGGDTTYLPTGFGELRLYVPNLPATIWCHTRRVAQARRHVDCDITLLDESGKVVADIKALRVTASPQKVARVDKWGEKMRRQALRYEWFDALRTEPKRVGHWAIVHDVRRQTEAEQLAQGIEVFGGTVRTRIEFGADFGVGGAVTHVRAEQRDDILRAIETAGPLHGVVLMHGIDASFEGDDPVAFEATRSFAWLIQALAHIPAASRPRVYLVTRGAYEAVEYDPPVDPAQTALAAMARVAYNELEGLRVSTIDLPREPSQDDWDALVLEAICDEPQDEVALRGDRRLYSELVERNDMVDADRVDQIAGKAAPAFKVRPALPGDETATARLIAIAPAPARENEIELRVQALTLPVSSFAEGAEDGLLETWVEFVGTVSAAGHGVGDLKAGQRVWGLAPAEVASQLRGPRDAFVLVDLPAAVSAESILQAGMHRAAAERALAAADLPDGSVVLAQDDALGLVTARLLREHGHTVVWIGDAERGQAEGFALCPPSVAGVDEAVARHTAGRGFDAVIAPAAAWLRGYGLGCVRAGGCVIDTAPRATAVALPAHVNALIRTDLEGLAQRRAALIAAMKLAVLAAQSPQWQPADILPVSVRDLVSERLPTPEEDVSVALTFDVEEATLPIARWDRPQFDPNATYLVTGGLGGFGERTAMWLIDGGARHLVVTSRTGIDSDERRNMVARLRSRGADVQVAAVDAADEAGMRALFEQIRSSGKPLKGIFHAAAVIIDETFQELDAQHLERTLQAKAKSAAILHELSREHPVEHFVLYSSAAVLVGNSRQGSYVAANGFLDGLATRRRAEGLPAISVNWGVIGDVGVVARDEKLDQFLRYSGLRGMDSSEALMLMGRAMMREVHHIGLVLISNWEVWSKFEVLGGTSQRFAKLIAGDSTSDSGVYDRVKSELAALPAAERFDTLATLMLGIVAAALETDAQSVPLDRPVIDLGIDSLMATEIQLSMSTDLGVTISVMQLLAEATMRDLVNKALEDFGLADGAQSSSPAVPTPAAQAA